MNKGRIKIHLPVVIHRLKVQIKRWERKKLFILRCGKGFDKVKYIGYETVRRRLETYK